MRRVRWAVGMVAVVLLAACGSGDDSTADDPTASAAPATTAAPTTTTAVQPAAASVVDAACAGLLESPETVPVQVPPLVEASGLAASRLQDGVLWAHNDSGDTARGFAFDDAGAHLGTFRLDGAQATDWEDMGLGPALGADGTILDDQDALYLADIGDNAAVRPSVTVYLVPEPEVPAATGDDGVVRSTLGDVAPFSFQYPDGPRDAEAFFVDRTTDSFYVIEKSLSGGPVGIYRGALENWLADAAALPTLELVGTYRPGPTAAAAVTGADITPAGDAIAVRTYGGVHLYPRPEGTEIADALATTPCRGPLPAELQGEAVALLPDGSAYLTVPEGSSPTLSIWRR